MTIRKLEYFIAAVEHGSFSNAAQHLYVSASAVNQQISALEQETSLVLFDRSGYRPILTPSGFLFYESTKKILQEYICAIEKARSAANILRVGPIGPVESEYLPRIIERFQVDHADIQFELKHGTFKMMREDLLSSNIDVAFGIEDDFDDPMIEVTHLKSLEMVVVCSKKHPLACASFVSGKQLKDYPLVIFSKETGEYYYQNMFNSFKLDGVNPVIHGTYHSIDELLTAVRIHKGIAVISKEVVKKQNDLVFIPLIETHHHSSYCIAHAKNTTPLCLSFVHFVIEQYKKDPSL